MGTFNGQLVYSSQKRDDMKYKFIFFQLLLLILLTTTVGTAFAKGQFSFITIAGSGLREVIKVVDPALTDDFFAFSEFFKSATEEPANPGEGYEVTRYFVDDGRDIAFDHLHYYPYTGYVYYDGLVTGWSEYDGKWYTAKAAIKDAFISAIKEQPDVSFVPFAGPAVVLIIIAVAIRRHKLQKRSG